MREGFPKYQNWELKNARELSKRLVLTYGPENCLKATTAVVNSVESAGTDFWYLVFIFTQRRAKRIYRLFEMIPPEPQLMP
jgi:hypothetical protein